MFVVLFVISLNHQSLFIYIFLPIISYSMLISALLAFFRKSQHIDTYPHNFTKLRKYIKKEWTCQKLINSSLFREELLSGNNISAWAIGKLQVLVYTKTFKYNNENMFKKFFNIDLFLELLIDLSWGRFTPSIIYYLFSFSKVNIFDFEKFRNLFSESRSVWFVLKSYRAYWNNIYKRKNDLKILPVKFSNESFIKVYIYRNEK